MGVDGVFGDAETATDLLGAQMLIDKPQTFALSRGQEIERRGGRHLFFPHGESSIGATPGLVYYAAKFTAQLRATL
jgi:hypothetical protein